MDIGNKSAIYIIFPKDLASQVQWLESDFQNCGINARLKPEFYIPQTPLESPADMPANFVIELARVDIDSIVNSLSDAMSRIQERLGVRKVWVRLIFREDQHETRYLLPGDIKSYAVALGAVKSDLSMQKHSISQERLWNKDQWMSSKDVCWPD